MTRRILINLALVLVAYFAPWWFLALVAVALMLYFNFYVEGVFVGFFLDAAFRAGYDTPFHVPFFFTVLFLILFFVLAGIKKRLTFYREI